MLVYTAFTVMSRHVRLRKNQEGSSMKQRLKVREIAERQGWTQAKLQRAADVNSRTMSGIWHDPYRRVTYEVLVKIARALHVEVTDLVEEEPD
jgi:DNA-binding Xre family transcriptional regulator